RGDRAAALLDLDLALDDHEERAARLILLDDGLSLAERDLVGVLGEPLEVPARQPLEQRDLAEQVGAAPAERPVRTRPSRRGRPPDPAARDRAGDGARERFEHVLAQRCFLHRTDEPETGSYPTRPARRNEHVRCWSRRSAAASVVPCGTGS